MKPNADNHEILLKDVDLILTPTGYEISDKDGRKGSIWYSQDRGIYILSYGRWDKRKTRLFLDCIEFDTMVEAVEYVRKKLKAAMAVPI